MEARLRKNANLRHVYYTHMADYIQRGQLEIVDPEEEQGGTFYLPHHAVSIGKKTLNGESCSTHPHTRKACPP